MAFQWPLNFEVMKPGEVTWETDRFGNKIPVQGDPVPVNVFAWEIVKSEEFDDKEFVMRIRDKMQILAPPGTFAPADEIEVPTVGKWQIEGNAEDSTNNPYFNSGLVTYHAKKVTG